MARIIDTETKNMVGKKVCAVLMQEVLTVLNVF